MRNYPIFFGPIESPLGYNRRSTLSLVYEIEVVIPVEVQASNFRVKQSNLLENLNEMSFNIDQVENAREQAFIKMAVYWQIRSQLF